MMVRLQDGLGVVGQCRGRLLKFLGLRLDLDFSSFLTE